MTARGRVFDASGRRRIFLVTDSQLVQRFLTGDEKAFEWLVTRHSRYAGAIALSIVRDEHEAADVVQETFIKVYRKVSTLKDLDRFRPWLRNIVRSTALDRLRKRKKTLSLDIGDDDNNKVLEPIAETVSPDDVLQSQELQQEIRARIMELPEAQREVVALKYIEGLSYEEIALQTSSSISSVESRLHRARARLREVFRGL
ncbi:MAG: sigma-70 family RNA polymerase sigma factor [Planctomycetota bacterium]|nr:sigma-70 family RNA polymerase sigma factor [Planctomycetota bacterium]